MFGVGFLELVVIGIVALLVIGPKRMPEALRLLGMTIRQLREVFEQIRTEIWPDMQGNLLSPAPPTFLEDLEPLEDDAAEGATAKSTVKASQKQVSKKAKPAVKGAKAKAAKPQAQKSGAPQKAPAGVAKAKKRPAKKEQGTS